MFVITPTWQRHQLLLDRCIPSVQAQVRPVRHIIVSDGPDPQLRLLINQLRDDTGAWIAYTELWMHPEDPINYGGHARNRGLAVARNLDPTAYVAYCDDDNALRPDHTQLCGLALDQNPTADFVYTRMHRHGIGDVIGTDPPVCGGIDSSLICHRGDMADRYGGWPAPEPPLLDWVMVEGWMARGARWYHIPEVTVDYYWKDATGDQPTT